MGLGRRSCPILSQPSHLTLTGPSSWLWAQTQDLNWSTEYEQADTWHALAQLTCPSWLCHCHETNTNISGLVFWPQEEKQVWITARLSRSPEKRLFQISQQPAGCPATRANHPTDKRSCLTNHQLTSRSVKNTQVCGCPWRCVLVYYTALLWYQTTHTCTGEPPGRALRGSKLGKSEHEKNNAATD